MKIPAVSAPPSPIPFLALLLVVAGCSSDTPGGGPPEGPQGPQPVIVEAIGETPQLTRVEAVGTSRAIQSITLYPADSGEVVAVNFEAGQAVDAGEILLELDQRDELLAVQLGEIRVADAERLHERYRRSAESGATLPTDLDASATALEEARIELDRARIALEDRRVKAPFAGHVGITDVEPGDRIQTSTAITTLDNRNQLLVSFEVPEVLVDDLRTGDAVAISPWNSREPTGYGEIVSIGSRIDPETRTFVARARVENSEDRLRPGQSFRVALEIFGNDYPVLPEIALQWGVDGAYVWSVVGDEARRLSVNVIQRQQGQVLVDGELTSGDLVVVEGIQRMRPGIQVIPESTAVAREDDDAPAPTSNRGPG